MQGKTANYLVLTFYAQTLTETTAFTFHSERSSHRSLSAVQSSPPALAHWTVTSLSHSSASPYLFSPPPSLCLPRRFLHHSFFRLFWLFRAPYQQVLAQLTHTEFKSLKSIHFDFSHCLLKFTLLFFFFYYLPPLLSKRESHLIDSKNNGEKRVQLKSFSKTSAFFFSGKNL